MRSQPKGKDSPFYKEDALRRNKDHQIERQRKWRSENPEKYKSQYVRNEKARCDRYRKNPSMYLWRVARVRAKKFEIPFDIDPDDVIIPDYCPITGEPIDILNSNYQNGASLDKIDNAAGYIKGNVRVISRKANRLKGDGTVEQFEKIIKYMKGEV